MIKALFSPKNLLSPLSIGVIITAFLFANPLIISDLRTHSFDDGTYSHAYLMPFIIAYLILMINHEGRLHYRFQPLFIVPFLAFWACYYIVDSAQIPLLSRFFWPIAVSCAIFIIYRPNLALVVPLGLLYFITPLWGPLQSVLQQISVIATTHMMSVTSIPVFVEGNMVHIPAGVFEIAGGCSGLRYFITSMALSLLYCFLNFTQTRSVFIFFAVAIVGSLITNWIRIVVIILIGHYTDMQSSVIEDHNALGWYLFVPFIIGLFYLGSKLEPAPQKRPPATPEKLHIAGAASVLVLVSVVSATAINSLAGTANTIGFAAVDLEASPMSVSLQAPHPVVVFYSDVKTETSDSGAITHHFVFNAESDGHRPDYYFNDLLPEGYQKLSHDVTRDKQSFVIQGFGSKQATLTVTYGANGEFVGSSGVYKLNRLKAAAALDKQSHLKWTFTPCEGVCR